MSEFLEKLSSYNIFNYLLPGVLFAVLGSEITSYNLIVDNLAVGAFLYYFYGLVISRVGSIALEPTLKTIKLVKFADYSDYVAASRADPKIDVLSEQNNSYRSIASVFLCLLLVKGLERIAVWLHFGGDEVLMCGVVGLLALFIAAYRKQTQYITSRISAQSRSGTGEPNDEANNS